MYDNERIQRGETRLVYVGDEYTVKIPIGDLFYINAYKSALREGDRHMADVFFRKYFRGLFANLLEMSLSTEYSDLAVPVVLSTGDVNMYKTVPTLNVHSITHEKIAMTLLHHGININKYPEIDHPLFSPENYGIHEGCVKLVDYGDEVVAELFTKERTAMQSALRDIGKHIGLL